MSGGRIRVAFIVDSFNVGGTELNAVRTAESLDQNKYEIVVYHLKNEGPLKARYQRLGIELIYTPISNLYSPWTVLQALKTCTDIHRRKMDVVHAHDIYSNIFIAVWARLLTSSTVVCSRRWGLIPSNPRLSWANRQSCCFAHIILTNSRSIREVIVSEDGVPQHKAFYLPNFLDDDAFEDTVRADRTEKLQSWGVPDGCFIVGSVSRLAPVKNLELLIDAVPHIDGRARFVIIGDGPCREDLEKRARSIHVDGRVHFVGELLETENLHSYFDMSVSCSHSEGFPNSIIEAMAAGNPVVATNVGGVRDAVDDRATGLLVEAGNLEEFVQAVNLLIRDSTLFEQFGTNARQVAFSRFRRELVIAQLEKIYHRLDRAVV